MTVEEVINAVEQFGLPELESFIQGICPCLPVEALGKLLVQVTQEIEARNEKDAMKSAIKAVDASVDAAEEEALKAGQWP